VVPSVNPVIVKLSLFDAVVGIVILTKLLTDNADANVIVLTDGESVTLVAYLISYKLPASKLFQVPSSPGAVQLNITLSAVAPELPVKSVTADGAILCAQVVAPFDKLPIFSNSSCTLIAK